MKVHFTNETPLLRYEFRHIYKTLRKGVNHPVSRASAREYISWLRGYEAGKASAR